MIRTLLRPAALLATTLVYLGAGLIAGLAAGCDSGYQVSLEVTDTINAACNTSCVMSVAVEAMGEDDGEYKCVNGVTMKSLRDHGMQGKIDLPVPENFRGVWVTGYRGANCNGTAMVDGIVPVTGSDVKVPMKCIASCNGTVAVPIQTTSVLAVAKGMCAKGTATTASAGTLRATELGLVYPNDNFIPNTEFTGEASVPVVDGLATVNGVVTTIPPHSCSAVTLYRDGAPTNTACIRFNSTAGLCTPAGKAEVASYDAPPLTDLTNGYRVIGVVAQRNGTTPLPILGATVTLDPTAAAGSRVEYLALDAAGTSLTVPTPALAATGAAGAFAVYTKEPVAVTVTLPGGAKLIRTVGGGIVYGASSEISVIGAQIFVVEPPPT